MREDGTGETILAKRRLSKKPDKDNSPDRKNSNSICVESGLKNIKKNKKPDFHSDRNKDVKVLLTRRQYQIYYYLIKRGLLQIDIAKKLKITKQTVNEHVKNLKILGVIKPIKEDASPKFFKPTTIIPSTKFAEGRKSRITINKYAKTPKRRVGKTIKTVRDHKTGRFKGKRKGRGEEFHRNYDTLLSIDGKRIPVLRVHSLSYTCTILRKPAEKIPWEKKEGPKGMEQWVLRHKFPNKKSEIDELKELEITFVRQKTKNYDELVIYLPEKYIFKFELGKTKEIMEEYVWKARKWFQNKYGLWLGLALPYRDMEIAHEIFDPALRRWVQKNGMAKVKTKRGYGVVDESKTGFPEREFTSIEQVKADLESGDRILDLEEQMRFMMQQQSQLMEQQGKMMETVTELTQDIQEFMGFRRKLEDRLEKESTDMFG